jgi:Protein of unknown function (DUF2442)
MLRDIIAAYALPEWKLHLTFEDGVTGVVDLSKLIQFTGVFEPLLDPTIFTQVRVDPELGTVCWDSGADLDPLVLYATITGQQLPQAS